MMVKYVIQFKAEAIKPMFIVASYYEVDENRVLNVYNDCNTIIFSANMSDILATHESARPVFVLYIRQYVKT